MHLGRRIFAFVFVLCLFFFCLGFSSAWAENDFSAHSAQISVVPYHSTTIVSGFLPGTTVREAAAEFENGSRFRFRSLNGEFLPAGSSFGTGTMICPNGTQLISELAFLAVFGDLDGNGKANSSDARLALRTAARLEKIGVLSQVAADCNLNGLVDAQDARMILRSAAKLEELKNPINAKPSDTVPVSLHAYYMGEPPLAGETIDLSNLRVIAVYGDARNVILEEGYSIDPDPPVSSSPGEKKFTVRYQGVSASFTVNFLERVPENCYTNSNVPSFDDFLGRKPSAIRFQYQSAVYEYSVFHTVQDISILLDYVDYLQSCGFVCFQEANQENMFGAVFDKGEQKGATAVVFDFTMQKIYVFAPLL